MIEVSVPEQPDEYRMFEVSETSESYWQEKAAYLQCALYEALEAEGWKFRQASESDASDLLDDVNSGLQSMVDSISAIYHPEV